MYIMCKAGQVANASKPAGYTLTFHLLPQEFKTRKSQTEALLYITETWIAYRGVTQWTEAEVLGQKFS